jgi:hypothetical protein
MRPLEIFVNVTALAFGLAVLAFLAVLERVDIHLVQMNALTRQRIDINARGVCS